MANAAGGGLCRVTVIAPRTRIDLALPDDVPLADLQPTLLRYAGEDLADEGTAKGGWVLARLGGMVLDSSRTAESLNIRDGEQLYFTPRATSAPDAVFDDVVDAIATATNERGGRWRASTTRRFGIGGAVAILLAGMLLTALAGPPQLPGAITALGVGAGLVATAAIVSRALSASQLGMALGLLGIGYAALGGLLLLAFDRPVTDLRAAHVLVAGAATVLFAVLAAVAVGDYAQVFLGATVCGVALAAGGLISLLTGTGAAGSGAVVGAAALAFTPLLPSAAFRLGRLPMPTIPSTPDELRADTQSVDGNRVLAQSEAADRHLTGLLTTTALLGLGAALCLAFGGTGWPRLILLGVLALVLLARARSFASRWQRLPLMVAGTAGLLLGAFACFAALPAMLRLVAVVPPTLALAVVFLVSGIGLARTRVLPVWTRIADILEVLLIVSIVPLTMWVCGAYAFIRAIKG